ncbi:MAG: ATP-binding cassette domain-containing protein, partial [Bradyrhizobium sp.]|nr:ATP-binding cassette domain-containing protein [Bradyrhizobium sp.]
NGAGKSTLMKIIAGVHTGFSGRFLLDGREVHFNSARDARAAGIAMVHQELSVAPDLTVAENVFLGNQPTNALGIVQWRRMAREAAEQLKKLGIDADPMSRLGDLPIGVQQLIEIARVLFSGARIIILDEPTSVLTPGEADEVLGMLRKMVEAGELTILMITHKFREVMAFADEVTILRRGKLAGRGKVSELTPDDMARMMIGAEQLTVQPARTGETGTIRLEVDRLVARDDAGGLAVHDLSLTVRAGEIVGIAGVSGNGQRQLVEVLAGQREAESGTIRVSGEAYSASREEMRRHKMSLLPEEPLKNACVGGMSVADNIALREFDRAPFARGGWWLNRSAFRQDATAKI